MYTQNKFLILGKILIFKSCDVLYIDCLCYDFIPEM